MTKSPRPQPKPGRTTKQDSSELSTPALLFMTALDTTWRAFVPTLGGVFLGIALDHVFNIAPIATIVCLLAGTALSIFLIAAQLRSVRRSQK